MYTSFSKLPYDQILREWLSEFKSLPSTAHANYAKMIKEKLDVMESLNHAFNAYQEKALMPLIQPCCHQLFNFFRTNLEELQMFVIALIPGAVRGYLSAYYSSAANSSEYKISVGSLLLSVYNILCEQRLKDEDKMQFPDLSHPSIFHDPMAFPFTEQTITTRTHGVKTTQLPTWGLHEHFNPSNTCQILNLLLTTYMDYSTVLGKSSFKQICKLTTMVASQAFPWQPTYDSNRIKGLRRISLSTDLSMTLLRTTYLALYNGENNLAVLAVEAMSKRANYEMKPQILLLCNAILNTINNEGLSNSKTSPLGLTLDLTPILTRTTSGVSRTAVTARSIKHHKWVHSSEEVSGDFTESLHREEIASVNQLAPEPSSSEESGKLDKHSVSPAKLLKQKIKKTIPTPSAGSQGSEHHNKKATNMSEKKNKKKLPAASSMEEEINQERIRTISGNSVEFSPARDQRYSVGAVPSIKQLSIDDLGHIDTLPEDVDSTRMVHEPVVHKLSGGSTKLENVKSPGISAAIKGKLEKSKSKNNKKNSHSESKDLLQNLLKTGGKKNKETKTVAHNDTLELLIPTAVTNNGANEDNDTDSYTTEM